MVESLPQFDELVSLFKQAIVCHHAGELQEAERYYLAVLQLEPNHAHVNFNMGRLKLQMKQAAASLPYFSAALEQDPASGKFWLGYIDALFQSGQCEEAVNLLALAKQQGLQGEQVDALEARIHGAASEQSRLISEVWQSEPLPIQSADHTVGCIDSSQKKESARHLGQVPSHQDIDNLLGLFGSGRYKEAVEIARAMTVLFPAHEFGWKALGAIFKQMGQVADALEPMQKAVELSPGDVEAHYNLGVACQELGRRNEAEACYREALTFNPDYLDAQVNLAVILIESGRLVEAKRHCQNALRINPDSLSALMIMGNIQKRLGNFYVAEASYQRILQINPDLIEAHFNLSSLFLDMGRLDEAEASYLHVLRVSPDYADTQCNLIHVIESVKRDRGALTSLFAQGKYFDAEVYARKMIEQFPYHGFGWKVLGALLGRGMITNEALEIMQKAVVLSPDDIDVHLNLGVGYQKLERLDEAEGCFRQALQLNPEYAAGHNSLGTLLQESGRLEEAEGSVRRAIQIKPDYVDAHYNLGVLLERMNRLKEAEIVYRRVLQLDPNYAAAYCNLGTVLHDLGRLDAASDSFRRSLQLKPDCVVSHSNLLFTLDLMPDKDAVFLSAERHRWGELHAAHLHQHIEHLNVPDAGRRLRIGYVSADFRMHSAAYSFGAMLVNFDRDQFDVIAYSNSNKEDQMTRLFRQNVTEWRNIRSLSDDVVADRIRQDQIDILVDLSGHTVGNRLLVFARKPAPIQISAWGYAAGTGMSAMDVFFTDPVMVPPDEKSLYAEQVRYLPIAIGSFMLGNNCPPVNTLPALSSKIITFGSFNRLVKNSDETYKAWAEILHGCAGSRMIIKTPSLDDADMRGKVMGYFARAGIESERIILQGATSRDEHLATYNQVDMALDPFPHGGGMTALEGLVMGVPMVTLRWPTLQGRISASILTTLGLTDWIAESSSQYVELAIQKASDLHALSVLRQQLRGIFTSSILGNEVAYVRTVEREYRQLWKGWCASYDAHDE